jgi:hypothetical protein
LIFIRSKGDQNMRVTKLFAGLGLAAILGITCPHAGLAAGHEGGGGGGFGGSGFHGGGFGGGGFHGGGANFGGLHAYSGGVQGGSAFHGGSVYRGTQSFSGIPNAMASRPSYGSAFRGGGANFTNRAFGNPGNFARSKNFRATINRPVNPQAWRHNGNWWNHAYVWNRGYYGNLGRYHYHYPLTSNWYWSPLWWGVNPYAYGYYGDDWPDYAYDYGYSPGYYTTTYATAPDDEGEAAVEGQPANLTPENTEAAGNGNWGSQFLASATEVFRQGQYSDALRLASHAAIEMPRDATPHVLISQALFALGDYRGANMESHAVLSLGSAPDWPTLYAYYGNVETYTKQLDKLADYLHKRPEASDARFVLGFQDLMLGHKDAALAQFEKVAAKVPQDKLAIAQIKSLGGTVEAKMSTPSKPAETPKSETAGRGSKTM